MHNLGNTKTADHETMGAVQTDLGALLLTAHGAVAQHEFEVPAECVPWLHAITARAMNDHPGSLAWRLRQMAIDLTNSDLMALAGYVARLERGYEAMIGEAVEESGGRIISLRRR